MEAELLIIALARLLYVISHMKEIHARQ